MVEAIVEHDYTAKEPDELTIKKGDIIKDVVKKQTGWCEGTLDDKKGLFPDNFVKLIDKEVTLRNKKDVHRIRECRVIFSYKPDHEDELSLNVGETIEIVGEEEEGWWKGILNGRIGVFPSNFVEEIFNSSKQNSVEDLTNNSDTEHKSPSLPPKPTKILCEVKYAYKAQNDDELTLKEGDLVTLISKDGQDAGWWRGELNGKIGVFPDNFVVLVDDKVKEDKKTTNDTSKSFVNKYIASQRKSFEPKPEPKVEAEVNRGIPPAIPGKKPSLPIKKSPSGSGGGGGLFSGIRKKIVDVVDGAGVSKSSKHEVKTDKSEESHENAFDQVERNSLLQDVRATRVKAPGRRPPSVVYKEGEPSVINGNSDYGSLEENLSSSNTSIEQETTEVKPKVREWEKHKAPWLEEMKLNQAKRTSTSPGPETRNKLTTPEKTLSESEEPKSASPVHEKDFSPVDMSKSMPSLSTKKTSDVEKTKILKTPPNELEKEKVVLRNKPVINSRPQTIETAKPINVNKISPILQATKTPSPNQKPQIVEKPTITEKELRSSNEIVTQKQYIELLERLHKLEMQNQINKAAIEDLRGKLQVETDLRLMLQADLEKVSQCIMQTNIDKLIPALGNKLQESDVYPDLPQLLAVSSDNVTMIYEDLDFDDLTRRFEALKKRK